MKEMETRPGGMFLFRRLFFVLLLLSAVFILEPTKIASAHAEAQSSKKKSSTSSGKKKEKPAKKKTSNQKEVAKQHFNKGIQFFKNGEYEAALAEFEAANQLQAHYITVFNIANTYLRLGRAGEAMEKYVLCIELAGDSMKPKIRKSIEKEMKQLEELVAVINIETNVSGTSVLVDGKEKKKIKGKSAKIFISAGVHDIEIRKSGLPTVLRKVTVTGGDTFNLKAKLTSEISLIVESNVVGASIRIGDSDIGKTPYQGYLPPGPYDIFITTEGYLPYQGVVTIESGKTAVVDLKLVKPGDKIHPAWFASTAAGTALTATLAITFGALALRAQSNFNNIKTTISQGTYESDELPSLQARGRSLLNDIDRYAAASDVFIGLSAACAVGTTILAFFTRFGKAESRAKITLSLNSVFYSPLSHNLVVLF